MVLARAMRPLLAGLALASACGNTSSYAPVILEIQAVAPVSQTSNLFNTGIPSGTTTILVSGLFLDSSSVVSVNGKPQKTTFAGDATAALHLQDARAVKVDLDPAISAVPQQVTITAQGPDTPASEPLAIAILETPAHVTTFTPQRVPAGSGDTQLTYTGTGFNSSVAVFIDGNRIPSTFVSATEVTAVIPASFLRTSELHTLLLTEQQDCPFACQTFADEETFSVDVP
jgi:hypothetical protein